MLSQEAAFRCSARIWRLDNPSGHLSGNPTTRALSDTALRTATGPWYVWLQIDWRNFKFIDSFYVEDKSKT